MTDQPDFRSRRHFIKLAAGVASVLGTGFAHATPVPYRSGAEDAARLPVADGATTNILDREAIARRHFGTDAGWYADTIPFFECSDARITRIYYYRWQVFRAHLRDLGERGHVFTEFLDDVSWDRAPFGTLNDSAVFPIRDGRWLRDRRYVNEFIDYLYAGGGNDRHFSESIADATYAHYLVHGDKAFALRQLDAMKHVFNLWEDHYDFSRHLYWIEPLLDATEYSIASIEASGGKDGFTGGQAFRPSINTYMYANARAIGRLCRLKGDDHAAAWYEKRAGDIRAHLVESLWNETFVHFVDRFKVTNEYVRYWEFICGRELVGYLPWYANIPPDTSRHAQAWKHLLRPDRLLGKFGMRTVEPSYQHYMQQYRYDKATGKPECQWNGPVWPFQTAQVLTGLANLLNDYSQRVIGRSDYVFLLRQFAALHLRDGHPDIQEDYDPDTGKVIVGLPRSHHYYHSSYVDLVINGLVGIRPGEDDELVVNPLVPADPEDPNYLRYFVLEHVPCRGHLLTVVWDADGHQYGHGAGLAVYVDGRKMAGAAQLQRLRLRVRQASLAPVSRRLNRAVNMARVGYPKPSASRNAKPESVFGAVDGRIWFFPRVANGWMVKGTGRDWFALEFDTPLTLDAMEAYFYSDADRFSMPDTCRVQYRRDGRWHDVVRVDTPDPSLHGDSREVARWRPVTARKFRLVLAHARSGIRLVEWRLFERVARATAEKNGTVPWDE